VSVKIRLMRVGKKKQPTYRVVVADSRSPRDGRIIEAIGKYGPRQEPSLVDIDGEKALAWLRKGAQPTEQVQKLLAAAGVWAEYEKEKGGPVKTKLARRGVTPGTTPPPPKQRPSKKAAAAEAAPAPPAPPPAAEKPAAAEAPAEAPAAEVAEAAAAEADTAEADTAEADTAEGSEEASS
jgi:small subunit ribosomal protein S16